MLLAIVLVGIASVMVRRQDAASDAGGQWGPLAVLAGGPTGAESLGGAGRLSITDDCVELRTDRKIGSLLLAWTATMVQWDSERRTIMFVDLDGKKVQLRHGDYITVGGRQGPVNRSNPPPQLQSSGGFSQAWIVEPAAACATYLWTVNSVGKS